MARVQFTFTFSNAQKRAGVGFNRQVFSSTSDTTVDGPELVLDSTNTVVVWSDAATLTASTSDGRGETITATATRDSTTVISDDGTPPAPTIVFASGTSHSDPGSPVSVAFAGDHSALSDAEFLHLVQRNYRVVQTGPPSGPTANGFGSCPLWVSSADASAGTVAVQTLDANVPFEVVG